MTQQYDEIVIGGGIMGMVYVYLLKQALPDTKVLLIESLDSPAKESSNPWNNAGTWHGANCEANYTPEKDGKVDISKALTIHEQSVKSLQLLSHLAKTGDLKDIKSVITRESHVSLMFGDMNRTFLQKRFKAMKTHHFFEAMKYSEDLADIKDWTAGLITNGREKNEALSATLIFNGAGINFGAFTKTVYKALQNVEGVDFKFSTRVKNIKTGKIEHQVHTTSGHYSAKKIFIAAGGGSLPLLQKTKTPESKRYAGFPVGGQFLVCKNPEIVSQLQAKIYGKASVGAPPMSVPHFDSRYIDGKHYILFGPKALFNPKFLINGSYFDLIKSIRIQNILAMLQVALKEFNLVTYLVSETFSGKKKLFKALQQFYPEAKMADWDMHTAGQRVQIIKRSERGPGGQLKLGTEAVIDQSHSIGALLGASPGASVATAAMLDMLEQLHPEEAHKTTWTQQLQKIVPTYRHDLAKEAELYRAMRAEVDPILGLDR